MRRPEVPSIHTDHVTFDGRAAFRQIPTSRSEAALAYIGLHLLTKAVLKATNRKPLTNLLLYQLPSSCPPRQPH